MTTPGRNEACPCGSGKKYKKCCAIKGEARRLSKLTLALLAAILAGGAYAAIVGLGDEGSAVAAPGRVWSPEHGHYH